MVLDVGCASGYLAKRLEKKGCKVVTLDKRRAYSKQSIVADLDNCSLPDLLQDVRFDYVILADVLEHVRWPDQLLKDLKGLLRKNGKMLISVPNIGFVTYRLLHLLGKWDYTNYGIMDKTHLRFFTKKTVLELVADYQVSRCIGIGNFTQLPIYMQTLYPLLGTRWWWRKIEFWLTGLWPEGLAIQFLIELKKPV